MKMKKYLLYVLPFAFLFFQISAYAERLQGIYLTQSTLENNDLLDYFIERSEEVGINAFIIDLEQSSKRYKQNIAKVKEHGIRYIARIVVFPDGGFAKQVRSREYWEKRYRLVKLALDWGADEIQLDYIRYNTSQRPSKQNAHHVLEVINFFKDRVAAQKVPLQIDVFGIASYGESFHIGQNISLFANSVNAICPMVYPSHYEPFKQHFANPYGTVFDSLIRIKSMFKNELPFRLYAWIELSNYHYSMSRNHKLEYIGAQLKAVHKADADGWFAWSANNMYDNLFNLLESQLRKQGKFPLINEARNSFAPPLFQASHANSLAILDKMAQKSIQICYQVKQNNS